ncbi:MAG: DedA family protein [Candidatus Hydrogenedentes bacterium]|nr:DedA family protein [Candidatus Hydrogenedentota bacterium]
MKIVRRMYDWVLSWAETPYGSVALFLLAFVESSIFPIPPDVLLIALCVGHRSKAFRFAAICTVGSVLGAMVGYAIGAGAWAAVDDYFFTYVPGFTHTTFDRVGGLYEEWNFWVVFAAAFTPLPYKVVTIAAGVFAINFPMFVIASIVGRSARFFLVAGLLYLYGEPIRVFIDKWFNLLVVVFTLLLIGGFVVLKYAMH